MANTADKRTMLFGLKPSSLSERNLTTIRALAPDMEVLATTERREVEAALASVEIAVNAFPLDLLAKAPKLRWFQQWGAGADWLWRYPELAAKDFAITSGSGIHSIPIGEHILAYLLTFARGFHHAVRAQMEGKWHKPREAVFELSGQTMVLVGMGAIGTHTARLASSLGVRVLGVRRNPEKASPYAEVMVATNRLPEILPEADFLVLTVPLTQETKGMVGEKELRAMKPSAYLINIGRGGTVNEHALIRALQEGRIAGAGLDVFESEPLAADSPLWTMENVIVTAHYAGVTPNRHARGMAIFLDNLKRYQAGEPLHNVIDTSLGY